MPFARYSQTGVEHLYELADPEARISQAGTEHLYAGAGSTPEEARFTQLGTEYLYTEDPGAERAHITQIGWEYLLRLPQQIQPEGMDEEVFNLGCGIGKVSHTGADDARTQGAVFIGHAGAECGKVSFSGADEGKLACP